MKLSFFICRFRSYRNFHGHVGNFIWKTYYIALRLCNKIVYASSRNLYARSLKIRKINYFLNWISYIFDGLKFDLGVNNFRYNLNKLLPIASLWTHCWKDTILTSSSDLYCNFYRLCPWLIIVQNVLPSAKLPGRPYVVLTWAVLTGSKISFSAAQTF